MNCPSINVFWNTYLKLDLRFRYSLISHWCRVQKLEYRGVFGHAPACNRLISTSSRVCQGQKDVTVALSPQEVTTTLRKNEFNLEFTEGSVKSYDSNQLASNSPIEDTRSEAKCKMTTGLLMGVYDGHGGPACAQVISKRMLYYIAAALLPIQHLKEYARKQTRPSLLETYNDNAEIVGDLKVIYENSFNKYIAELVEKAQEPDVPISLEKAILKLDDDLSKEVLEPFKEKGDINTKTLSVALSGAVACVSHIDGPHLHVANIGDCNAVLGVMTEDNEWIAKKITKEHNSENYDELRRIWNEHPVEERKTVIRRDRLLGELAPLRSIGDYRYKWPEKTLADVAVPFLGPKAIPQNYHTPPYLTAKPDILYHRLTPKDKFLIIASDGIWDMLTPLQAVKLVGEHMKGKVHFNPLKLPKKDIQLGDINELLLHRKESLKSKPKDRNAATHLIRHAIGGTEYGVDHARLSQLLSLAPDVSRMFRDDMTVTIAYFDEEFLRQCPA
ncbi:pyruvate dehydrogenase [acetyl-transferring]-phosphatase 1, mitochondrial [Pectinophora gossypiella]|nr:pyruvate dehydrogenase [acetyl-transferring]-phosphatase 1, mitochondrial [Pectinophora gossypiella]